MSQREVDQVRPQFSVPVVADAGVSGQSRSQASCVRGLHARGPPSRGGRPPAFDAGRYRERNTVERCFGKLKQFRAVATRYDKREIIYQGTVDLASIRIWLQDPVS